MRVAYIYAILVKATANTYNTACWITSSVFHPILYIG